MPVGQTYVESVLWLVTLTPLEFLTEVLPMVYNDCQYVI